MAEMELKQTANRTCLTFEGSKLGWRKLNAARIILCVQSVSKGQEATETLEQSTGRTGCIQVEEHDTGSTDSVRDFAARIWETARVDAVLLNAGVYTHEFVMQDRFENTLIVNVLNAF
ncbi:hypothetical protein BDV06DRAFT_221897 [Aspergillus oleicola]